MDHQNIWGHNKFPNPVDSTEIIVLFLRQDITILSRKLTVGFVVVFIAFFVKLQLQNTLGFTDNSAWFYLVNMGFFGFVCLLMLRFAFDCHNYFLSFWAFTQLRIVEFKQNNFFQADVQSIWYKNVEKTELTSKKVANTLSNFGDIVLSMKGEGEQKQSIAINNIPNPKYILDLLNTWIK
jgi:hypothetical protein